MKTLREIRENKRITVEQVGIDGGCGTIRMINWKGSVVWSNGHGWDHVSVSPYTESITPSWDDMCKIKDMFFYDEEEAFQFHPKKSEYVNMMPNCLHLWRLQGVGSPRPPIQMV